MPMRARLDATLLTRPPRLLHALLPGCEWAGPATTPAGQPIVYLTFDDGPVPGETPWVLAQLAEYQAKATFFCVGENLARHPDIARAALAAGHRLGNHTQHHRSAWASNRAGYLAGVRSGFPAAFAPADGAHLRGESGDWLAKLEAPVAGGRLTILGTVRRPAAR